MQKGSRWLTWLHASNQPPGPARRVEPESANAQRVKGNARAGKTAQSSTARLRPVVRPPGMTNEYPRARSSSITRRMASLLRARPSCSSTIAPGETRVAHPPRHRLRIASHAILAAHAPAHEAHAAAQQRGFEKNILQPHRRAKPADRRHARAAQRLVAGIDLRAQPPRPQPPKNMRRMRLGMIGQRVPGRHQRARRLPVAARDSALSQKTSPAPRAAPSPRPSRRLASPSGPSSIVSHTSLPFGRKRVATRTSQPHDGATIA